MQKYLKEVFIWVYEFVLKKKILWLFIIGSEYFFEQSCCRKQTIRHELHYNRHPQNSYWGHDGFFLAPKAILGHFYNICFIRIWINMILIHEEIFFFSFLGNWLWLFLERYPIRKTYDGILQIVSERVMRIRTMFLPEKTANGNNSLLRPPFLNQVSNRSPLLFSRS